MDACATCNLVVPLDALECHCCCRNCEVKGGEVMNGVSGGRMWGADMEALEEDLHARLGEVTATRLRVEPAAIMEVLSTWLADNGLSVVNDDMEILEL